MLKKEFQKHDVERLRNLIKGKSSSRTTQGVGYTKSSSEDHEEGDIWEENGRDLIFVTVLWYKRKYN